MIASDDRNTCDLPARISALALSDQRLVQRFIETLEARASASTETPEQRIRRRIEAVRARND